MLRSAITPGPRTAVARALLTVLLVAVAGLFLVRFGILGMVLGGGYIAGGGAVTAQLDSETRFLSTIACGVGLGVLWLSLKARFEAYPAAVVLLTGTALVGGLVRVVSMGLVGRPETAAMIATGIEIAVPVVTLFLLTCHETG